MRASLIALAMAAVTAGVCAPAIASEPDVDDVTESARAPTKFRYFSGAPATHPARRLRWYYNPANEPPALAGL
jgi:hypothetical protein